VVEVIRRMDEAAAAALARDISELWALVETLDDGAPDPDAGRALRQAPRRVRPRVPDGGSVLIAVGSTDGHTRSLMGFAAAELSSAGYQVAVREAAHAEAGVEVAGFAAVLVGASIHWGRYQSSVIDFAKQNHEALNARAAALISVSLSAAGVAQPEPGTLDDYVDALRNETQWEPSAVHHVGGRIRHSGYDYFQRLAITLIAAQRGDTPNANLDYDLADYAALKAFVTDFVAG
jgi:menaquinone-dependent protoporphyrinogen oxidase